MPAHEPYISVVVAARNDNHGGNMLARMQAFLDSWIVQAQRYSLPSEIVVVEWNSPEGAGKLKDSLRWPECTRPCGVRFVEVPPEIHRSLPYAAAIPLHQMIAKNTGIRRARGQFVLSTNLDIIFSADLMQFLACRRLDHGALYRMDRYDISNQFPAEACIDDLLAFCRTHILRVSAREGTWGTSGARLRPVEARDILAPDCGIRLGDGWYGVSADEDSLARYLAPPAEVVFERPPSAPPHLIFDVEAGPSARDGWVELDVHDAGGAQVACAIVDGRYQLRLELPREIASGTFSLGVRNGGFPLLHDPRMLDLRVHGIRWAELDVSGRGRGGWKLEVIDRRPGTKWSGYEQTENPFASCMRNAAYLHTNGCGDFTMLSRQAWFGLRGYPEVPIWPMHIDSLLCYSAYHAGFPEIVLRDPMRIFHIQHESAAGSTPSGEKELYQRVAGKGVPIIEYPELLRYLVHMRRFNAPLVFSGRNWGLADQPLPETELQDGAWTCP